MIGVSNALEAGQLAHLYAPFVRTFMCRLGLSDAWVDDAVQDVFIVAHKLGGYQPGPASPKTWLCEISKRIAANARRKHHRYARVIVPISDVQEPSAGYSALDLHKVLAALEDTDRDVLSRFYLQGQSCLEIAADTESPVGTIYRRLHTARIRFAELLS